MQHLKQSFAAYSPFCAFPPQLLYYVLFCAACNLPRAWGPTPALGLWAGCPGLPGAGGDGAVLARPRNARRPPEGPPAPAPLPCEPAGTATPRHVEQSKVVASSVLC